MNYDMVVLAWAATLLRQRATNEPVDHYLVVAIWTLPVTMMLAGAIHIPLALLTLSAFAARLVWLLARDEARESDVRQVSMLSDSIVMPAKVGTHASIRSA
jgi:hypothetical protein